MIPLHDDVPGRRFPIVTVALLAANVAAFVFELTLPRYGITLNGLFHRAGLIPFEVVHRMDVPPRDVVPWWLTPVTSMFLHGGWFHIIFNMLFLWIFANNVEDEMGHTRFLLFYLLCGLAAAATQIAVSHDSTVPTIGASGAIAGVLGAYIVLYPRARVLSLVPIFLFISLIYVPAWVLLAFWFVSQLLVGIASLGATTGVAYFAHIGGFVAGLLLVFLFASGAGDRGRPGPSSPALVHRPGHPGGGRWW